MKHMFLLNMYQKISVLSLLIILLNILSKVQCNFEDCYGNYCKETKERNSILKCKEITLNDFNIEKNVDKCSESIKTIKITKENELKFTNDTNLLKFLKKFTNLIWFDANIITKFRPKFVFGIDIHKIDTLNGVKSLFLTNNSSIIKMIETTDSIVLQNCQNYEVFNKTDFTLLNEILINKLSKSFWKTIQSSRIFKWINNKIISIDPNWSLLMFDNGKPYREDLNFLSSLDFQRCLVDFCKNPQTTLSCYATDDTEETVIGNIPMDLDTCMSQITVLKLYQKNIRIVKNGLSQFVSLVSLEFDRPDQLITIDECALFSLVSLRFIKMHNRKYATERKMMNLFELNKELVYMEIGDNIAARNCEKIELYLKPSSYLGSYKVTTIKDCSIILKFRNSTLTTLGVIIIIIFIILILILKRIISICI